MKVKRALVSVSDKTNLLPLARALVKFGVEIFSTGGTLAILKENRIPARAVSELTQFPEMLGGRLKTLHPKVHGGLLFLRGDKGQVKEAKRHGIEPIDLVVVNLYPFRETVRGSVQRPPVILSEAKDLANSRSFGQHSGRRPQDDTAPERSPVRKPSVKFEEAVEQIDIGGPAMLRSGAKNFESVTVVCDPQDYPKLIEELSTKNGVTSQELRREFAAKVFRHTSSYDREIARYLSAEKTAAGELPERLDVVYERSETLRYGENPHQRAALYRREGGEARFTFKQLHGKQLSFNNLLDFEAAVDVLREFSGPAVCVVKHNNPCGISEDKDLVLAAIQAIDSDPLSAFGGIVGLSQDCDEKAAKAILDRLQFFEIILAPQFSKAALSLLTSRKNLRILEVPDLYHTGPYDLKFTKMGVLLQDRDEPLAKKEAALKKSLKWVTKSRLAAGEIDSAIFAWKCAKVVRSNAIVLVQGKRTVGVGGGQMSRVDSVKIACMKAGERAQGSILASDGFFPMPDNIDVAHSNGIRAIVQPGGSIRDQEVIDACDRYGIAMAFAGTRHFKH